MEYNFMNVRTGRTYGYKDCQTVSVSVIAPYRDSFKISVPLYGASIDEYICYELNRRYPRRSVQVRPVEYNYSIL